jgi:hypothetical protein
MVTVDKACIFRRSRSQWKVEDVWWKEVLVLGVRAGKREDISQIHPIHLPCHPFIYLYT